MAQEVEILVALHESIDKALAAMAPFENKGIKQIVDVYYHDPLRPELSWKGVRFDCCCRIREQNGQCKLTYKVNHFDGDAWLYADEYETTVGDAVIAKQIFAKLGLQELVTVHNTRHVFKTGDYEIVIEDVANLGCFMEVEYQGTAVAHESVSALKQQVMDFIQTLGLRVGPEEKLGKPELMLRKIEGTT